MKAVLVATVNQLVQQNQNLMNQKLNQDPNALNVNSTPPTTVTAMTKAIDQKWPSTFNGKGESVRLENWIREFDKIFETVNCPDELKISCVAFYLRKEADI